MNIQEHASYTSKRKSVVNWLLNICMAVVSQKKKESQVIHPFGLKMMTTWVYDIEKKGKARENTFNRMQIPNNECNPYTQVSDSRINGHHFSQDSQDN